MSTGAADRSWRDLLAEGRLPRFALIVLGVWLNAADALVVATIMPSVGAELGGYAHFGWATAGFFTGSILAGAAAGRVAALFGLRRAMVAAGLLYAAGCALGALSPEIATFLAARLLQGVGGGWIVGFAHVAIGQMFPERHLARTFAAVAGVWGIATLLGPLVGGVFAEAGAWRGAFWFFAVQAAGFSLAALWLLPRDVRGEAARTLSLGPAALIAAGVAAVGLSGLSRSLAAAAALGVVGLALLAAALRLDARSAGNLFPRQAASPDSPLGAGYGAMFAMSVAGMGLVVYGPALLQTLHGLSPIAAGYVIGAESLAWTAAAVLVSGAGPAWRRRWIRTGPVLLAAALAWQAMVVRDGPLMPIVAAAALQGGAFGVCYGFLSQAILGLAPASERGIAASALAATQQTGAAVGAALVGATANFAGAEGSVFSLEAARTTAVWVFAAGLPPALLAVWRGPRLAASAQLR